MAKTEISYQSALQELETIIAQLEEEETEIDNLSEMVQRASFLVDFCRNKLRETEEQLKETLK